MITIICILSIILYIMMGVIVGIKQNKALLKGSFDSEDAPEVVAFILAIVWPLTLIYYIIRVVFFEKWI